MRRLLFIAPGVLVLLVTLQAADFQVAESDLPKPLVLIGYGDIRFTDSSNHDATNPKVRRWLVDKIAEEHPAALLVSGDLPWHGAVANDYAVFQTETKPWRDAGVRVYPALGNHELNGDLQKCLENWWTAFPQLRGRRWYSVQFGDGIYFLNVDSDASFVPDSDQARWIAKELASVPKDIRYLFVNLHHPPVSDFQADGNDSHNVRPNEAALAIQLKKYAAHSAARVIVVAGHVHNYERFFQDGIVYLVSGGGGAKPRAVTRTAADLYRGTEFPNYHYVRFAFKDSGLDATMIRVADPEADQPTWQERDHFEVTVRPRAAAATP